nr:molybdopterin-dependent oxidoreductase [Dehalococcoidales bacterium]
EGGRIFPVDGSEPGVELAQVAALCFQDGISLREEGWFKASHGALQGHTFMASLADVAVDVLTGTVTVKKLVCSHDTGKAINPLGVIGQLYGGAVQSQGYALTENLLCEDGEVRTASLTEYLVPTSLDIPPELTAVIVEEASPTGPFGAKGLGEHVMGSVPPAILNAVCDAVGARLTRLPIHPQEVLDAIQRNA